MALLYSSLLSNTLKTLVANKIIGCVCLPSVFLAGGGMGDRGKTVGGVFPALANIRLDNIKKM